MMFGKKNKKPKFDDVASEIQRFKEHVASIPCPACKQKTLAVESLEEGELKEIDPVRMKTLNPVRFTGWHAQIKCQNCNLVGILNNKGFSFTGIDSKGKAVKDLKK